MSWESLTEDDQDKIRYFAGHLRSSEDYPEGADSAASGELAWDGFVELKKEWLIEFGTWVSNHLGLDVFTVNEAVDMFLAVKERE